MENRKITSILLTDEDLKPVNLYRSEVPDLENIFSAMTHELRTPVAVIQSNVELLSQKDIQLDESMKDDCLSMCADSNEIIRKFLNQLQFLLSAFRNEVKPNLSAFRIREICQNQISELRKLNFDVKRISIHWDTKVEELISDPDFTGRILLHLLTNALKFSRKDILLGISAKEGKLTLKVQDFGSGIPENEQELIFIPFHRSENVKRISGMGLGLAEVKIMTECLGGEISLVSAIDTGTIFQVSIPYTL
ncbi:MAG: HAMP domain-containing sensor histidine kinase [Prolixibacteraceae bacterium]